MCTCVCVCVCVSLSLSLSFSDLFLRLHGIIRPEEVGKRVRIHHQGSKKPTSTANNNNTQQQQQQERHHQQRAQPALRPAPVLWHAGGPGSWAPTGRWDRPPAAPGWPTSYITMRLCTKGIIANSLIIIIIIILLLLLFSFWGRWEGERGIRNQESGIQNQNRNQNLSFLVFCFSNSIL